MIFRADSTIFAFPALLCLFYDTILCLLDSGVQLWIHVSSLESRFGYINRLSCHQLTVETAMQRLHYVLCPVLNAGEPILQTQIVSNNPDKRCGANFRVR